MENKLNGSGGSSSAIPRVVRNELPCEPPCSTGTSSRNLKWVRTTETNMINPNTLVHSLTGVSRLHELNLTGSGITVALIDDGVDYLHPALGGGFGANYKVHFGMDLVGDDFSATTPKLQNPFPDPYSECTQHGTHTSGIVAGHDSQLGFVGVAPGAKLEMYRVTACHLDYVEADAVIQAIMIAHSRSVDVISASMGFLAGTWPDDPVSELLSRIIQEPSGKTLVVFSAGNKGLIGPFSARSPTGVEGILTAGFTQSEHMQEVYPRGEFVLPSGETVSFPWVPYHPSRFPEELPLCALILRPELTSQDEYACEALPLSQPLSEHCVMLVRRGHCDYTVKMNNVFAASARYAIIYDSTDGNDLFDIPSTIDAFPGIRGAGFVSNRVGRQLIDALVTAGDGNIRLRLDSNFTQRPYITPVGPIPDEAVPGSIASHSSWGPDAFMRLMPSVSAPGGFILSSVPRSSGGYKILSGSSMAAPYVAGCAALIRQAHPDASADEIRRRLAATAVPLVFNDGTNKSYPAGLLHPVWQQGSGRINCFEAARATSLLDKISLAINDTTQSQTHHTFTIFNTDANSKLYKIGHLPAATVNALGRDGKLNRLVHLSEVSREAVAASEEFLDSIDGDTHAHIGFDFGRSHTQVIVPPHSQASMTVELDIGELEAMNASCPLYSGYITIDIFDETRGDRTETESQSRLVLPYGGIACDLGSIPVLTEAYRNKTYLTEATMLDDDNRDDHKVEPGHVFRIPIEGVQPHDNFTLLPSVHLQLAMQTSSVSVELVPATSGPGPEDLDDASGLTPWPLCDLPLYNGLTAAVFANEEALKKPGGFSRETTETLKWSGKLANGGLAMEGQEYYFRVCGLRMWEDRNSPQARADCINTENFMVQYI
jgi:subtilisin family serine protease